MIHVKLEPEDVLLVRSVFGNRTLSKCFVVKTTRKTVITKSYRGSTMTDRHGKHFGNTLFVYDEEKYIRINNIQSHIIKQQKIIDEIMNTLEIVHIMGE